MKAALDTNVLVYAEGRGDAARCLRARELVGRLAHGDVLIPVQVLGELQRVLTGKAGRSAAEAREAMQSWCDAFETADTTLAAMQAAHDLAADHQLGIWDAVILSTAAQAGCRVLLSEDFASGFTWGGVTVVNPFASPTPPLLATLLADEG
jgi:predicted nucleic acid-binding protein